MKKILQKMPLKRLKGIARGYLIDRVDEKNREELIEEIYELSIKTQPVDKDGNPLYLS